MQPREQSIQVRVSSRELARYRRTAERLGLSLSAWTRLALSTEAGDMAATRELVRAELARSPGGRYKARRDAQARRARARK
jgi:hypothetical protein